MMRFWGKLIILGYVILLTGCNNCVGEKTSEETGPQVFTNQVVEGDGSRKRKLQSEEIESMEERVSLDCTWQEMLDIEVGYLSDLGYHRSRIRTYNSDAFICWKDVLSIGSAVYRHEDGKYEKMEESLQEWIGIEDALTFNYYQWNNLLVFFDAGVILDMDSGRLGTFPFDGVVRTAFQGKVYYTGEKGDLLCKNLLTGEIETIYAVDGKGIGQVLVRNGGDVVICVRNAARETETRTWEYWLLSHDEYGEMRAKKIWQADSWEGGYKYLEMVEFNVRGLFLYREHYGDGPLADFVCLTDDGKIEEIVQEEWASFSGQIIVDEGYFLWDSQRLSGKEKGEILGNFSWSSDNLKKAATVVDSISYYDFQGNKLKTWRLIEDGMLESGYRLADIVYGNGEIFAFYVNEETDDLYISKVQPWEGGAVVQE